MCPYVSNTMVVIVVYECEGLRNDSSQGARSTVNESSRRVPSLWGSPAECKLIILCASFAYKFTTVILCRMNRVQYTRTIVYGVLCSVDRTPNIRILYSYLLVLLFCYVFKWMFTLSSLYTQECSRERRGVREAYEMRIQSDAAGLAISVSRSSRPTNGGARSLMRWGTRSRIPTGIYLGSDA